MNRVYCFAIQFSFLEYGFWKNWVLIALDSATKYIRLLEYIFIIFSMI